MNDFEQRIAAMSGKQVKEVLLGIVLALRAGDADQCCQMLRDSGLEEELVECGCCGCFHRPDYSGDCRNDAERFPVPCLPYPGYTPKTD